MVAVVLTAVLTGLVVTALVAVLLARTRRQEAATRDGIVREAVERAVAVAGSELERSLASGGRDTDTRNAAIHRQMTDLASSLRHVGGLVSDLQRDRAAQHGELLTRIGEARRVTESLASTAEGLQRALASPQARGQWGERMCEDVLRAVGFAEGVNYVKQRTLPDGTRPDVTFLLPDERLLHMDVKFPFAGYLRWCEATTEPERAGAQEAFLRDVRNRIKELARPGYADDTTVGFVLLFIPNESVYGFIHAKDSRLADEALARRVVLCSPFTLFAVLGVIRQAVDALALQHGADEILDVLAGFESRWEQFCGRLDALGKHLQTATNSFDQVNGARRRQLERQLDKVDAIRTRRETERQCAVNIGAGAPMSAAGSVADDGSWGLYRGGRTA